MVHTSQHHEASVVVFLSFGPCMQKCWFSWPFSVMAVWVIFTIWQPYMLNDMSNLYTVTEE